MRAAVLFTLLLVVVAAVLAVLLAVGLHELAQRVSEGMSLGVIVAGVA